MYLVTMSFLPSLQIQYQKFGFPKYSAQFQSNTVTTCINIFSFPLIFSILNITCSFFLILFCSSASFLICKVVSFTKLGKFLTIICSKKFFFYSIISSSSTSFLLQTFSILVLVHTSLMFWVIFFLLQIGYFLLFYLQVH